MTLVGAKVEPATNGVSNNNQCTVREQDRFMPIANVIRIMRKVLPPHAKISDDAKETMQECVSEYISFITSEANDRCQREQRKTITAEDVLWAMDKLGFDSYIEPLTTYLHKYREVEGDHRGSIRGEPLPLRRTASVANLAPLPPVMPLPMASNGEAYRIVSPQIMTYHHHHSHHHQQYGMYGEHVMGGGYYMGMSLSTNYGGGGDGDVGGGSSSSPHSNGGASFDPYTGYK